MRSAGLRRCALLLGLLLLLTPGCGLADGRGAAARDGGGDAGGDASAVSPDAVDAPLSVLGLSPGRGDTDGGLEVRIHGTGLRGVVEVRFGATPAAGWFTEGDEFGVATTPAHPAGVVDVVLRDIDGAEVRLESAFVFEEPVAVSAVEPATGSVRGGETVRVAGRGFGPDAVLTIGGRRAPQVALLPDGSLSALTPEGVAGSADVYVRSGSGLGALPGGFTYTEAPTLRRVVPAAGPRQQPTRLVLEGAGFTADAQVSVGGLAALDVVVSSPTRLEATAPALAGPGDAVTGAVVVTVAAGEAALEGAFTWLPDLPGPPTVHAVVPGAGPLSGGGAVAVVTSGFSDPSGASVRFGAATAQAAPGASGPGVLVVRAPSSEATGPVDVQVQAPDGSATLAAGYTYRAEPLVVEVTPNSGAAGGGTRVVVHGSGFTPDATVRVGPLLATDVSFLDAGTLEATTPPGSPGLATVRVQQQGGESALAGGFHYTGPPAVDAISPPQGSVAGGTLVLVHGAGFTAGTALRFGEKAARDLVVLGPTLLEARTPSGLAGRADVTLLVPGEAAAVATGAWLYFDPGAEAGFWGPPIDRNVDVTVYDTVTGGRVSSAMVVVGPTANTPARGYSDAHGQITIGRRDLSGPLTLSASKVGYGVTSIVDVDASHVALGLGPIPQCSDIPDDTPCNPPPQVGATLDGSASGNFKGVKIPWGRCDLAGPTAGGLCDACDTDEDCGGRPCVEIPDQGRYCTVGCQSPADCPAGYGCYPLGGSIGLACVPAGGELRTYCDVTNPSMYSNDPIPYPGVLVGPDGHFDTPTRLGDQAVFCWSGIEEQGHFTPQRLGVVRHRGAYVDGDIVLADVHLDHVLSAEVPVLLDRPALGSPLSESVQLRSFIDLGGDGVLELPPVTGFGRSALVPTLVPALTGDLADASYSFMAFVSSSEAPEGYSVTIRTGVTAIDSDQALRLGPDGFELRPGFATTVRGMTPVGDTLLAVGEDGLITRNTGGDWWAVQPSGTRQTLLAVSAAPGGAAIAVGEAGLALHYDGLVWEPVATGAENLDLQGVWMADTERAWAVGGLQVLSWDGASWQPEATMPTAPLAVSGLAASSAQAEDTLVVAGSSGLLARREADGFRVLPTGTAARLESVWVAPDGSAFAVGEFGVALRLVGDEVIVDPTPNTHHLYSVWGDEAGTVWAVGALGTILAWDGESWSDRSVRDVRSTLYAVSGTGADTWALGAHELVLGPMMGLPRKLQPPAGAPLDHELSWTTDTSHPAQLVVASFGDQAGPCIICGQQFAIPYTRRNIYARGSSNTLRYPDFSGIAGTSEPPLGQQSMTLYRAWLSDDFDFDEATGAQLDGAGWTSYSVFQRTFF
ncbi:MAG: IPT/TIG domain-containing protein [Deltaproteobacteria bacterium]|nr:IPT/TIG domain-containing protein [Deltaproteobacteria bacterium]MCB9789295.1 IPT/TIG domain-containing protein [Deltaproteobacteria bacterium]